MGNFTLQHLVLYSKHWYKHGKDFWSDIKKCLTADGYSGEYFTNNDCVRVILHQFEKLEYKEYRNSLSSFVDGIDELNCWKYGYYTKSHTWFKSDEELPEYDQKEAIVRYCLSNFCILTNTEWKVIPPDFKKCLPRSNGIKDKNIKEIFKTV